MRRVLLVLGMLSLAGAAAAEEAVSVTVAGMDPGIYVRPAKKGPCKVFVCRKTEKMVRFKGVPVSPEACGDNHLVGKLDGNILHIEGKGDFRFSEGAEKCWGIPVPPQSLKTKI